MGIQGPRLQNISQGLIHQLNRHATNKEVGRSLIGPVNSAIHIDNHNRFAGRVESDLKHSKGLLSCAISPDPLRMTTMNLSY